MEFAPVGIERVILKEITHGTLPCPKIVRER
jgi:hypothetical protein